MNATAMLPPTPRDFEIHHSVAIAHISTRMVAEQHRISQTRIRQIVYRVNTWLAHTLPAKTDLEREQEVRLAQHLAADQLNHQIELLKDYFEGSSNPKYIRQQTRVILSLARLGIVPGTIDSLAADATDGPYDPNVVRSGPDRTEAEPTLNSSLTSPTNLVTRVPPGDAVSRGSSLGDLPTTSGRINPPNHQTPPSSSLSPPPSSFPPPPPGDCSPTNGNGQPPAANPNTQSLPTPSIPTPSVRSAASIQRSIDDLNFFEKRLLTIHDSGRFKTPDELASYHQNIGDISRERALLQLQLSPNNPGATITVPPPTSSHSPSPQLETCNAEPVT